ncbi:hypothetical protein HNQ51_002981 [Inhella inkyongensis]|uniref:Uncharacterized protein n=1 Tax=Inhella inkyongensis TaxID=392593 RepID=A0A840SA46_9BURK|nr:hypothetical protein [Inhella inkyongensis]MBB5205654.1 hypothetical protein [Inhella inkyongensis]
MTSLSGSYRFRGLGTQRAQHFPNPWVDLEALQPDSLLTLSQTRETLNWRWQHRDGQWVERSLALHAPGPGVQWQDGVLSHEQEVPVRGVPILPGQVRHHRGLRVYRSNDGRLMLEGTFRETGRMLFLLPFEDRHQWTLALEPAG